MSIPRSKKQTKSAEVIVLLSRAKGATLDEVCQATNWQSHSVRAFLTGLRKKGLVLAKEQRGDGGTSYRITKTPEPATAKSENVD